MKTKADKAVEVYNKYKRTTHAKEMWEREHNCKVITIEQLKKHKWGNEVVRLLETVDRYGHLDSTMIVSVPNVDNVSGSEIEYEWVRIKFFTTDHIYSISIHFKETLSESYLGCTASTRKPRAGETWNRGSDLADGKFNDATWYQILGDIVSYEIEGLKWGN